jgi:hypothetical protein
MQVNQDRATLVAWAADEQHRAGGCDSQCNRCAQRVKGHGRRDRPNARAATIQGRPERRSRTGLAGDSRIG